MTGSSVVAFKYKDGVLMAADTMGELETEAGCQSLLALRAMHIRRLICLGRGASPPKPLDSTRPQDCLVYCQQLS